MLWSLDHVVLEAIKKLWKNDAPSKVLVFGWRFLLDRLLTRSALSHRGILNNPNDCLVFFALTIWRKQLIYSFTVHSVRVYGKRFLIGLERVSLQSSTVAIILQGLRICFGIKKMDKLIT
jgi:hypothetical protein